MLRGIHSVIEVHSIALALGGNLRKALVLACAAFFGGLATLWAQPAPTRIPDAVSCPTCEITSSIQTTIGTPAAGYSLRRRPYQVVLDGRGRFWAADMNEPTAIFDNHGRYLRDVGRVGRGPGEFLRGVPVIPMGDSIMVIDQRGRRATVLGPDFRSVESIPMQDWFASMLWLKDRSFVGSGVVRSPGSIGWQLHLFRIAPPQASIAKSIGLGNGIFTGPFEAPYMWKLATAAGGGFWASDQVQYRISRWSAEGKPEQILERVADWFLPSETVSLGGRQKPPSTFVDGIAEDEAGLIWTFVKIPATNWQEIWRPPAQPTAGVSDVQSTMDESKLWDTRVEVIDPKVGRVIARRTFRADFISAMTGRQSAWYVETAAGEPQVQVLRLDLVRR